MTGNERKLKRGNLGWIRGVVVSVELLIAGFFLQSFLFFSICIVFVFVIFWFTIKIIVITGIKITVETVPLFASDCLDLRSVKSSEKSSKSTFNQSLKRHKAEILRNEKISPACDEMLLFRNVSYVLFRTLIEHEFKRFFGGFHARTIRPVRCKKCQSQLWPLFVGVSTFIFTLIISITDDLSFYKFVYWVFHVLVEFDGVWWVLMEFEGVWRSLMEFEGVWWVLNGAFLFFHSLFQLWSVLNLWGVMLFLRIAWMNAQAGMGMKLHLEFEMSFFFCSLQLVNSAKDVSREMTIIVLCFIHSQGCS